MTDEFRVSTKKDSPRRMTTEQTTRETTAGQFRKKPIVVDAVHYEGHGNFANHFVPEWMWAAFGAGSARAASDQVGLEIRTRQGWVVAKPGDWICHQSVNGQPDIWPCDAEAFAATYEPASPTPTPAPGGGETVQDGRRTQDINAALVTLHFGLRLA